MTPNTRRALLWSTLGLLLAAFIIWSFWPQAVAVDVATVVRAPMRVVVSDEGRTRVREAFQLSAPVNGRLLRIERHAGDAVIGGETVLAELLPIAPSFLDVRTRAQAELAVNAAEAARSLAAAEVARARAELAFASSELARAETLAKSEAISRSTLERAQLTFNTATAQLATAQAALRVKEFDLASAKALLIDPSNPASGRREPDSISLVAPVTGRILRVLHENEAVVAAGAPIMEIGDPQNLEVVVELISEEAVKVHEGANADITDWGGSGSLVARVRRVEPSGFTKISALGVEEQRVNVLLDITDPRPGWRALADGYRVIANIVIWQQDGVIQVPASALFRQGTGWAVFVVRAAHAVLTPIKVGHGNEKTSQVLGGLNVGDRVIVHPSDRVADGGRVTERSEK